jgi:hypothetical protein
MLYAGQLHQRVGATQRCKDSARPIPVLPISQRAAGCSSAVRHRLLPSMAARQARLHIMAQAQGVQVAHSSSPTAVRCVVR